MAVGLMGMLDLSIVTDKLIAQLDHAVSNSLLWPPVGSGPPFPLTVSGSMPEAVRGDGGCQVSLYLFHVAQDPYQLNVPLNLPQNAVVPPPQESYQIPFLPLSLDLYYLLTAFADKSYVQEQQAMSVAMRSLHENPILRATVVLDGQNVAEEFTVAMAVESADELGRLWQAVTAPLRLSAVYKVSVAFLAPEALETVPAPDVERIVTVATPTELPFNALGQVSGTSIAASYHLPDGTIRPDDLAPAVAAPGDELVLHGGALDQATAARVFLLPPGQPRVEVTGWRIDGPPRSATSARIALPAAVGVAPAGTPDPGVYQLQVGTDTALGDPTTYSSNTTPFSIAARVDAAGGPVLAPAAGLFALTGAGFVAGRTEVLLGTVPLAGVGGAPAAGEFAIGGGGTTIDFRAPATLPAGRYAVRVRVNEVESRPALWVDL
jgi:Pvc16 N-terminal domain